MKNQIVKQAKALWNDESAQGATEYILLLVVVVALLAMFKDKIMGMVSNKVGDLSNQIGQFK